LSNYPSLVKVTLERNTKEAIGKKRKIHLYKDIIRRKRKKTEKGKEKKGKTR